MSIMEVNFAIKCVNAHQNAVEHWSEGKVVKIWKDENDTLCIYYESGRWWHYKKTKSGAIEWW